MQNSTRVLVAAALVVAFTLTQMTAGELVINKAYGETPEHVGSLFMDPARSDIESFVSLTEIWTMDAIKYRVNIFDRWAVNIQTWYAILTPRLPMTSPLPQPNSQSHSGFPRGIPAHQQGSRISAGGST